MKIQKNDYVYHFTGLGGKVRKTTKAFMHVDTQLGVRVWNYDDVTLSVHSRVKKSLLRFFKWFFKIK